MGEKGRVAMAEAAAAKAAALLQPRRIVTSLDKVRAVAKDAAVVSGLEARIKEKSMWNKVKGTVRSLNNVAALDIIHGRREEAESRYRRAHSLAREHLGETNMITSTAAWNLVALLLEQHREDEAILLMRTLA